MLATVFSAAVTCIASLFIGQAALRLSGAREWSWLAPPVGISVVMLIAVPAIDVPGRCATVAALVAVLSIAAIVWCGLAPAHRPPLGGLLAAAPVMGLVLVPYLTAGGAGIPGTSMDNDMAAHMLFVEQYLSHAVANVTPLRPDYPFGPHATVALISEGFGIRVDEAFAGWLMALPVLNAWTAVALVRRASWLKQAVTATVVGMPFLVAAYYGEGSFKEVLQAGLVLAVALLFGGFGPRLGRGRWVPFALLLGGIVSVYSITGLPWPALIAALWLVVTVARRIVRHGRRSLREAALGELPSVGIGLAVLLLVLLPQAHRIYSFASLNLGGNGIITPKNNLANLVAPLPGWEAFGVWNNPDFRLPPSPAFTGGMWTAFVLALVLFGAFWCIRRGRWLLPGAAAVSMLIWQASMPSQSPYTVAKALVIASPLLLALAVLPLMEQIPDRSLRPIWPSVVKSAPGQPLAWGLAALLAAVLFVKVGISDGRALRASPVGPTAHAEELRELRPLLDTQPTLFLGDDDFIKWELAGVPVHAPDFGGIQKSPMRPQKHWSPGMALDFDSVNAATLNSYRYVITTRDAAGSAPPPQFHLVGGTRDFELWKRVGNVRERSVLNEGEWPGAVLECKTAKGRAVLAGGGVAAIRRIPRVATMPLVPPGGSVSIGLNLPPGRWELETPYNSRFPVEVTAPGLETTLPANLDRPGPRLPIGRLIVREPGPTSVTFHVEDTALAPASALSSFNRLVITPAGRPDRIVPIREACGKYVDWYRARPAGVPE